MKVNSDEHKWRKKLIIYRNHLNQRNCRPEVFCKKGVLEISQNSQENTCVKSSGLQLYEKRDSGQVFSCEFGEISKNTFFYRTPLVAASETTHSIIHSERKARYIHLVNFIYLCLYSRAIIKSL